VPSYCAVCAKAGVAISAAAEKPITNNCLIIEAFLQARRSPVQVVFFGVTVAS
jgi:hypothetical protein